MARESIGYHYLDSKGVLHEGTPGEKTDWIMYYYFTQETGTWAELGNFNRETTLSINPRVSRTTAKRIIAKSIADKVINDTDILKKLGLK